VQGEINPSLLTSDDKWILLKLNDAIREITESLNSYNFSTAVQALYRFFWSEYCDWYVEATKAVLTRPASEASPSLLKGERAGVRGENESDASYKEDAPPHPDPLPSVQRGGEGTAAGASGSLDDRTAARRANTLAVIDFVLSHTLRLFHPFLPFITEELWQGMGFNGDLPQGQGGDTIMFAHWPKPFDGEFRDHYGLDDCYLQFAENKYETVRFGRNLRSQFNIQSNRKVNFILKAPEEMIPHDVAVLKLLLNAETLTVDAAYLPAKGVPMIPTPLGELYLPLEGLIDVEAEKARLTKELEKVLAEIEKVKVKLANPNFTSKVPPEVLREHEERLTNWQQREQQIRNALEVLGE
jgi:valyl-tRNA synthetase